MPSCKQTIASHRWQSAVTHDRKTDDRTIETRGPVAHRSIAPLMTVWVESACSAAHRHHHSLPLAMKAVVVLLKAAAAASFGSLTGPSNVFGFLVCPKVAHRRSSRGSGICNQAGSVHVPLRAISDDQDVPPIVKRRPAERNFISILSEDGTEQALPVASASSFPLWVIDGEIDRAGRKQVTQVPGANEELGWVNPRSYTELWIPEGSPAPTMKLCLGMLMKDGVPRYVMPMVDLVVEKEGRSWRNRGLNSVPIAHAWEPVARAAAGSLFLSAYAEERVEGSETDSIWGSLAEKLPVADAFQDIVSVLADPPEGLDLGSGFHFVVAEVDDAGADSVGPLAVAGPGGRVRVFLSDLSEPADLLDLEETGGVRGVAALGFDVFSVANGGESEFLPEVYRPFFKPEKGSD